MLHKTWILIFLFTSLNVFAQAELVVLDTGCVCDAKIQDPYEEPVKFNFGKYAGSCVDSCRFRPAKFIEQKKIKKSKDELLISNYLHLSTYRLAVIPYKKIQSLEVAFEEFRPGINHIFLKFTLAPDAKVTLYSQSAKPEKVATTSTVIISAEGVMAKGNQYSLLESYFEHYLLLNRVQSFEEVEAVNVKLKHPIKYYPLNVSPELASRILEKGLRQSEASGLKDIYRLFSNNCSTTALSLLDSALQFPAKDYFSNLEQALPVQGSFGLLQALKERQILNLTN